MARRGLTSALALFCLALACGRGDPSLVAAGGNWTLTRDQVAREHDRLHGAGSFHRLTIEHRREFLETVIQKELLLAEARASVRDYPQSARRRLAVGLEDELVREYFRQLRRSFRPDSAIVRRGLERLARDLHARVLVVPAGSTADSVRTDLDRGATFEQIWDRYARGRSREGKDLGWKDPFQFPPPVIEQAVLVDRQPDEVVGPIRARPGIWFLQIREYRPFDPASRPGSRSRGTAFVRNSLLRQRSESVRDSLRSACAFRLHPEAALVAGRAIGGYLDSLLAALPPGEQLDHWTLRPPLWRLTDADRGLAVADLNGSAFSLSEFFRTLESADDRYWPRLGDEAVAIETARRRLDRLLAAEAARARGLDRSPEYLESRSRIEGDVLLDTWHDQVLMTGITVTSAETEAMIARDPARWKIPERVEFAAVVFPEGMEEEARRFREEVAQADPRRWTEEAERALEEIEGVQFIRTSELLDVNRPPDPISWAPLLQAATGLSEPGVTGPVAAPELGGTAVVRLILRAAARPVAPEVARVMAEREVRVLKSEAKLEEILQRASQKGGVRRWPDRLAAEPE